MHIGFFKPLAKMHDRHRIHRFKSKDHRDAGYVVQALIDRDRGNQNGAQSAIDTLVHTNQHLADADSVNRGLDELLAELNDERRVRGISRP